MGFLAWDRIEIYYDLKDIKMSDTGLQSPLICFKLKKLNGMKCILLKMPFVLFFKKKGFSSYKMIPFEKVTLEKKSIICNIAVW